MINNPKEEILKTLSDAGVSPTPVRILVYKTLSETLFPLSLSDIETLLESVDKSTVSRTLMTFKNHNLVRSFNDGSGSLKYELTHDLKGHLNDDVHVHFRCEKCGVTSCLNDVSVPPIKLPQGFVLKEVNYVVSGFCADCSDSILHHE